MVDAEAPLPATVWIRGWPTADPEQRIAAKMSLKDASTSFDGINRHRMVKYFIAFDNCLIQCDWRHKFDHR